MKQVTRRHEGTVHRLIRPEGRHPGESCGKCSLSSHPNCGGVYFPDCFDAGAYWEEVKPPRCPFCGRRMELSYWPFWGGRWSVEHCCPERPIRSDFEYEGPMRKTKAGAISAARRDLTKRFRRWLEKEDV